MDFKSVPDPTSHSPLPWRTRRTPEGVEIVAHDGNIVGAFAGNTDRGPAGLARLLLNLRLIVAATNSCADIDVEELEQAARMRVKFGCLAILREAALRAINRR